MNYEGTERRVNKRYEHDLLIRIDANLTNFLDRFEKHEKADNEIYVGFGKRISLLEKAVWTFIGAVTLFAFVLKIMNK